MGGYREGGDTLLSRVLRMKSVNLDYYEGESAVCRSDSFMFIRKPTMPLSSFLGNSQLLCSKTE